MIPTAGVPEAYAKWSITRVIKVHACNQVCKNLENQPKLEAVTNWGLFIGNILNLAEIQHQRVLRPLFKLQLQLAHQLEWLNLPALLRAAALKQRCAAGLGPPRFRSLQVGAVQAWIWELRGNGTAEVIAELCLQRPSEPTKPLQGTLLSSLLLIVLVLAFCNP